MKLQLKIFAGSISCHFHDCEAQLFTSLLMLAVL